MIILTDDVEIRDVANDSCVRPPFICRRADQCGACVPRHGRFPLVSVGYSVITFASSSFNYGLNATVADLFLGASLDDDAYAELVLQGYADTIVENESVVEANGRRLPKAQSALLTALLAVLVSTVLYFVGSDRLVEYALLGIVGVATWRLNRYVLSGAFLVYDEQPFRKDDGPG